MIPKAFQKMKMCRGLYTRGMVEFQGKQPNSETLTGYISVIFNQKFINGHSFSFYKVSFSSCIAFFVAKFEKKKKSF